MTKEQILIKIKSLKQTLQKDDYIDRDIIDRQNK